jgi:hypothetical protein
VTLTEVSPGRILALVFVVHGTKKFLDRMHSATPPAPDPQPATTILGAWYATVLFWQPQLALFVNEPTRLPLFVPLAPAATVIQRMPQTATTVLTALGLSEEFITREVTEMASHQLTKTANRSVLGTMNDFAYLADAHRTPHKSTDLLQLSLRLAQTPCGPLYRSHVSPDREITAYVTEYTR